MSLTMEEMRQPISRKREEVAVPEFGDGKTVWVYALSAGEMNLVNASMMNAKWEGIDKEKITQRTHRIMCFAIRDENGNRLLSDDDISIVAEWPTEMYDRIWDVANALNGKATQTKKNLDVIDGE
jgi:hypothetical protein